MQRTIRGISGIAAGTEAVTVTGGLFSALLGSYTPLSPLAFDGAYWLEVEVYNEQTSGWETFSSRRQLASAPYALRAGKIDDGVIGSTSLAPGCVTEEKIVDGAITDSKVASSGVSAEKITSGSIDNARINWASPGSIGVSTQAPGYFSSLSVSGEMGVGTDSPVSKLHISGGDITLDDNKAMVFGTIDARLRMYKDGDGVIWLRQEGNHWPDMHLYLGRTADAEVPGLFIKASGGRVGIGTTDPLAALEIREEEEHLLLLRDETGATGGKLVFCELQQSDPLDEIPEVKPSIRFHHHNKYWHRIESGSEGFHFKTGDTASDDHVPVFAADGSFDGSLGVGTTTPLEKLHVNGGNIYLQGTSDPSFFIGENQASGCHGILSWISSQQHFNLTTTDEDDALILQQQGGRVAIGPVEPQAKLHLLSTYDSCLVAGYAGKSHAFSESCRPDQIPSPL